MNEFDQILSVIAERVNSVDWESEMNRLLSMLKQIAVKAGRVTMRQVLTLYYTLKEGDLSSSDKMKVYAALAYVILPSDLLPRKFFGMLGIADDVAAVAYVYTRLTRSITPAIQLKVDIKLDEWFGYEIS